MKEVAIVIPNYNGMQYLETCLTSLARQSFCDFTVYLVNNGSTDQSRSYVAEHFPEVKWIQLDQNYGFSRAVNEGILHSIEPYIVLLNNDTQAEETFVEELLQGIRRHPKAFSAGAKMLSWQERDKIDDAGNYYNMLGWAFARGKGSAETRYQKEQKVFTACAGAAIYRRSLLEETGLFDEEHFAYLEDLDIGYRARILGYENWFLPEARVYHVGSGTSGSRYNLFKIRYSSRNNIYLIYKNMPVLQLLLNLPALTLGFLAKLVFFASKGYGREYAAGIKNGFSISRKKENRAKKVRFSFGHLWNYIVIQWELFLNVFRRFLR